jgi:hypothetical protein
MVLLASLAAKVAVVAIVEPVTAHQFFTLMLTLVQLHAYLAVLRTGSLSQDDATFVTLFVRPALIVEIIALVVLLDYTSINKPASLNALPVSLLHL